MGRVRFGDEKAMMLLYDRYSRLVFSLAVHILADRQLAEDITQDVFLALWRNAGSFDSEKGSLAGWLTVVTRHRAIDVVRKRSREYSESLDLRTDRNAQRQIEISESTTRMNAVLSGMPISQQVALRLSYFSGLTHAEISAETGIPLGTVKSRIRSALEFLRKALGDQPSGSLCQSADPHRKAKR